MKNPPMAWYHSGSWDYRSLCDSPGVLYERISERNYAAIRYRVVILCQMS